MKKYTHYERRDPRPEIPFSEQESDDDYAAPIAICMLVVAILLWSLP